MAKKKLPQGKSQKGSSVGKKSGFKGGNKQARSKGEGHSFNKFNNKNGPSPNRKYQHGNTNRKKSKAKKDEDCNFEEVTEDVKLASDFFGGDDDDDDGLEKDARHLVRQQNRKKKKSGGFQSMGLSHPVFSAIIRKGYKIPTPIQRKTIPMILEGKDVVAMARTGSGKTAAFLIPMFERLNNHLTTGARAMILSPTRELALQTLKFAQELGKFTGLKTAVILGGDSMQAQFQAIHEHPDLIIATPGRFMHIIVEMELKLSSIEYVVFDEADRLFELGFQEQLSEILHRLPENRQTVLFSATLPKLLVDFAKAGLQDPILIRLDVDSKLSENLRLVFLQCREADKLAVLLHLLRNVVKPSQQTVIFVATKHDVEYLNLVLEQANFSCSHCYSALDQAARKINVAKFRSRKTRVLLVTDLAARGIDIPLLDNVINYNFPSKCKLFVHRVGRVARAGSSGTAYSLVANDELPYVLDLHLFLGRPFKQAMVGEKVDDSDGVIGRVPQSVIDEEETLLKQWHEIHDIESLAKVTQNAYKNYIRSRPLPATESIKRMKELNSAKIGYHPIFGKIADNLESARADLLESMRNFKPKGTIFEINSQKKMDAFNVMKTKRQLHGNVIQLVKTKQQMKENSINYNLSSAQNCDEADIDAAFSKIVAPKAPTNTFIDEKMKKRKGFVRDEENFLKYKPTDFESELGLKLTSFEKDATSATLDLDGDDADEMRKRKGAMMWDRKRKRFVSQTGQDLKSKKIKTESGRWIKATYKTKIYKDWLDRSKVKERLEADDDEPPNKLKHRRGMEVLGYSGNKKGATLGPRPGNQGKNLRPELKPKEQILKERRKKRELRNAMKQRELRNKSRKSR